MTFSYCVSAAGSNVASQVMCVDQAIALNELKVLVNSCNATTLPMADCTTFAKAVGYGVCGNRAVCNLFYKGSINDCFNEALNATAISCVSPTTAPAASHSFLPLAIVLPIVGATVAIGVALLCCKYKSKISELWNKCCHGYEPLKGENPYDEV